MQLFTWLKYYGNFLIYAIIFCLQDFDALLFYIFYVLFSVFHFFKKRNTFAELKKCSFVYVYKQNINWVLFLKIKQASTTSTKSGAVS